jgi:hypothetical protein
MSVEQAWQQCAEAQRLLAKAYATPRFFGVEEVEARIEAASENWKAAVKQWRLANDARAAMPKPEPTPKRRRAGARR